MTVRDRGFKKHLVQKTNFSIDVSESPEPTPKEEEDEEDFLNLLRRRCDGDEAVSPCTTPKRRLTKESQVETPLTKESQVETAKKSRLMPYRIPQDTAPLTT